MSWGFAWLQHEGFLYWSKSRVEMGSQEFRPVRDSSVIRLVESVYELDPRKARLLLRERIYTNEPLLESTWGTVKVAAKRIDFDCVLLPPVLEKTLELVGTGGSRDEVLEDRQLLERLHAEHFETSDGIWGACEDLLSLAKSRLGAQVALPVSALLLDAQGRMLSWGVNTAWDQRTQHAEVNLIRRWLRWGSPGIPASLWVTRKSCKMCAGAIWDSFLRPRDLSLLQVRYRDPDDGPMARLTVLGAGTTERRRAVAQPAWGPGWITRVIEVKDDQLLPR